MKQQKTCSCRDVQFILADNLMADDAIKLKLDCTLMYNFEQLGMKIRIQICSTAPLSMLALFSKP